MSTGLHLTGWANICPGTESRMAGLANFPAPTPGPGNLGGLICMAQAQGQGLALCTRQGWGVEGQRTHTQQHLAFVDLSRV